MSLTAAELLALPSPPKDVPSTSLSADDLLTLPSPDKAPAQASSLSSDDLLALPSPPGLSGPDPRERENPRSVPSGTAVPPSVPKDEGSFASGSSRQGFITDSEIAEIAAKTGASPAFIRKMAPIHELVPTTPSDPKDPSVLEGLGSIAQATAGRALGVLPIDPRDVYRKLGVSDPKEELALDALMDLRREQRSYVQAGMDLAGMIALGGAVAKGTSAAGKALVKAEEIGPKAALWIGRAFGLGAAGGMGALSSKQGEEEGGAMLGAGFYVGVPAIVGVAKALTWGTSKLASAATSRMIMKDVVEQVPVERVDDLYKAAAPAEKVLEKQILQHADSLPNKEQWAAGASRQDVEHLASLYRGPPAPTAGAEPTDSLSDAAHAVLGLGKDDVVGRAWSVLREQSALLAKSLGAGGTKGTLGDAIRRSTTETDLGHATKQIERLRRSQYLFQELEKGGAEAKHLGDIGPLQKVFTFLSDARYVYDGIDARFGTEMAPILDHLTLAYNASTWVTSSTLKALQPVVKGLKEVEKETLKGGAFDSEAIWIAFQRGHFDPEVYTPKQIEAMKGLRSYFSSSADIVEGLHELYPQLGLTAIKIQRKVAGPDKTYIPHMAVPLPEMISRLRVRLAPEMADEGAGIMARAAAGDEVAAETLKGLKLFLGHEVTDARTFKDAIFKLKEGTRTEDAVRSSAAALFERQEAIPSFLLNKDVVDLATKWVGSTYRHAFMRDALANMAVQADALASVSPVLSQYVRNHVTDMLGSRQGTIANAIQRQGDKVRIWADERLQEATGPAAKTWWGLVGSLPDFSRATSGSVYSYYLGLRVDSAVRNMAQAATMTAPSLSFLKHPIDVMERTAAGYTASVLSLAKGDGTKVLSGKHLVPSSQLFEAQRELEGSLARSPFLSKMQKGNDALNALAMSLYETADVVSRVTTKHMAEGIVRDAFKGNEAALSHLSVVSPGYLSAIRRALKTGDEAKATDLYTSYLNGSTLFNYNRASMSEFGRAIGPILSMFSKWPTAILGEVAGYADAKLIGRPMPGSLNRVGVKLVMPLIALDWAQEELWKDGAEEIPGAQAIIGKDVRKFAASDVVAQLAEITDGKVPAHVPPVVSTAGGVLSGLIHQDGTKVGRALVDGAMATAPGGAWIKLFLETAPEMISGEPIVRFKASELVPKD